MITTHSVSTLWAVGAHAALTEMVANGKISDPEVAAKTIAFLGTAPRQIQDMSSNLDAVIEDVKRSIK